MKTTITKRLKNLAALLGVSMALSTLSAYATVYTWTSGSGNWSDPNWQPGNVTGPTSGSDTAVVAGGPVTVDVNNNVGTVGSIVITNGGTLLATVFHYNIYGNLLLEGGTLDTANGPYASYGSSELVAVTAAGSTPSTISDSTGSWFGLGTVAYSSPYTITPGTFTVNAGAMLTVSASLRGAVVYVDYDQSGNSYSASGLIKSGSGTLVLSGVNTYSGMTTVSNGTLTVSTVSTGGGGYTVVDGATLGVSVISAGSLKVSSLSMGNSTNAFDSISTVTPAITNSGALTLAGTVTVNVSGSVAGGQYPLIGSASITGTGGFVVGSLPVGYSGTISTNGSTIVLTLNSGGPTISTATATPNPANLGATVLLSVTATASGGSSVSSVVVNASAIGGSSSLLLVSAGGNVYTNSVLVASATSYGSALSLPVTATDNLSRPSAGNISLTVNSPSLLTWNGGTGNWSAVNWLPNNLLSPVIAAPANGSGVVAVVANGQVTVDVNNSVGNFGSVVITNGGTLLATVFHYNIYTNLLFEGGTLDTANGPYAQYGSSELVAVTAAGSTPSTISDSTGSWFGLGTVAFYSPYTITPGTFTVSNGAVLTVSASLRGAVVNTDYDQSGNSYSASGLIKSGSGRLVLSGVNTYTGNTTINGGTLEIAQAVIATSSTVSIASGAKLQLDFAGNNNVAALVLNGVSQPGGTYNSTTTPAYFAAGTGSLVVSGPTGPGTITNSVSGSTLNLTWPAGQSWRLVSQTNSLSSGLSATGWGTVSGAADGSYSIPIDPTQPTVFYKLVYP